jgi:pimeloyl-ACP methyl ester carboxylesterase
MMEANTVAGADGDAVPPLPELRFAQIPPSAQAKYTGDRFSYMETGQPDGFPILLLHGIGANAMHWRYQFTGLGRHYRVIAWNAPGYMLSDNLREEAPDGRAYADALADFAAALAIDRFHILGNSFGTRVAQFFAAHHPGRAIRMALTGTGIGQRTMAQEDRSRLIAARAKQVESGGYGFGSGRVAALLGSKAPRGTAALVQHVLQATNPRGFMQAARFVLGDCYTPDFADRLTMPVLLIQGSEDKVNPLERNAAILLEALPQGRLEVLDGYGHLPEIEAPVRVNEMVLAFFGG